MSPRYNGVAVYKHMW